MQFPTKARLAVAAVATSALGMGVAAPSFAATTHADNAKPADYKPTDPLNLVAQVSGGGPGSQDITVTITGSEAGVPASSLQYSVLWDDDHTQDTPVTALPDSGTTTVSHHYTDANVGVDQYFQVTLTDGVNPANDQEISVQVDPGFAQDGPAFTDTVTPGAAGSLQATVSNIDLTALSDSDAGQPLEYVLVNWGDGESTFVPAAQTAVGPVLATIPAHTYAKAGSYPVNVGLTDEYNMTGSVTTSVVVPPAPGGGTTPPPGGGGGTTPPPASGPTVQRIAGADRFLTGIALSQQEFKTPNTAPAVVLATGSTYPDALSGVSLAKKLGAPLLLVPSTAGSDLTAVTAEVNRVLKSGGAIYILGGENALPDSVLAGIPATNRTRLAGTDRFATALAIANSTAMGSPKNVVLATGLSFADALAVGPYAADVFGGGNAAILLTDGASLAPGDAAYLANATSVAAAGGPAVAAAAAGHITLTKSFDGTDRYNTTQLVDAAFPAADIKAAGVATSGAENTSQFADALTGAVFIANAGGPLVLTDNGTLPTASQLALNGIAKALNNTGVVTIFGGSTAVNEVAAGEIVYAVGGTRATGTIAP